jgi:hypothetical protein
LLTFDPTANLWPGATILRKYNDDILSKTWGIKEKVTTGYVKFGIDSEYGKGTRARKRRCAGCEYRPVVFGLSSAGVGSDVVLDQSVQGLRDQMAPPTPTCCLH